jgi:hypothetical protein
MNRERKIIQNKTCVQNKRKHKTKKKNHQAIFFYLNFSSFIKKKQKPKRHHHSPITQAQTMIKSIYEIIFQKNETTRHSYSTS